MRVRIGIKVFGGGLMVLLGVGRKANVREPIQVRNVARSFGESRASELVVGFDHRFVFIVFVSRWVLLESFMAYRADRR